MLKRFFLMLLGKAKLTRQWEVNTGLSRDEYQMIRELFASKKP